MKQKIKKETRSINPFFTKIRNLNEDFYSKTIFISFFLSILGVFWIILFSIGFQPKWVNYVGNADLVRVVPLEIQTLRGMSIFALLWYTVFLVWDIIQITWYFKLSKDSKQLAFSMLVSWIPLLNIITIVSASKYSSYLNLRNYLHSPFSIDQRIHKSAIEWKWGMNMAAVALMTPMVIMTFFPGYEGKPDIPTPDGSPIPSVVLDNLWFDGFHFFTIQTNFMCYFYLVFKLAMPQAKMFRNDSMLLCLIAYIFIVSITYNAVLLPSNGSDLLTWTPRDWVKTCWEHMIDPLLFITVGFISMRHNRKLEGTKFDLLSTLKFGMIIPSVYLMYAIILPFFTTKSVYGWVTNLNNTLPNTFTPVPHGDWYIIFFPIAYWWVFVGCISLAWYIRNKIYAKTLPIDSYINEIILYDEQSKR